MLLFRTRERPGIFHVAITRDFVGDLTPKEIQT